MKARLIAALSASLAVEAHRAGLATNPAFSGAYSLKADDDFASIFPLFLRDMPDHALVMCHPGFVDEALKAADPVHEPREAEHAYFSSEAFPAALAAHGFTLDQAR